MAVYTNLDASKDIISKYEPLWGTWYVDSLLGSGSFGRVYKIHRQEFGKTYTSAVKILSIPQDEAEIRHMRSENFDDMSIRKFLRACVMNIIAEIDLMNEFRGNSHIVSFEDHKVIEKPHEIGYDILIRMELLQSLSDYVTQTPLSYTETLRLGIHICQALELCARKNIIHRDIKPDNIFLSQYGDYKLGDFGIARHIEGTMSGLSKKGTYTYMAPEIFRGNPYGRSVDTYSLGIVLYRFLNRNRTPFLPEFPQPLMPDDRDNALQRRMSGEPLPFLKGVSYELNSFVQQACAYDPRNRFANPTAMREALEFIARASSGIPINTLPASASPQMTGPSQMSGPSQMTEPLQMTGPSQMSATPQMSDGSGYMPRTADGAMEIPAFNKTRASTSERPRNRKKKALLLSLIAVLGACGVLAAVWVFFLNDFSSEPDTPIPALNGTISIDCSEQSLTDKQLVSMIRAKTIPPNVTRLNVSSNQITDIVSLESLTKLKELTLDFNDIGDLAPLEPLTELTQLSIRGTTSSDLTPLRSLTSLTTLIVEGSNLNDITLIKSLTDLKTLTIYNSTLTQEQMDSLKTALPRCKIELKEND
ncbi:MAG: serine/threonine protein kinase [Peptococcaceae bacterium]|nr:serine/threonine protein kinase [Peptococcaceae bacterium]